MQVTFRSLEPGFWVSPQIRPDMLAAAKELGVGLIISNRPDGEEPGQPTAAEMAEAAGALGMAFAHFPVVGRPDADAVRAMAQALDAAPGGVLAFCRSGTRSTFAWALARAGSGRIAPEDLVAAADRAGYDLRPLFG